MRKEIFVLVAALMLPFSTYADGGRQVGLHVSYSEGGDIVESGTGAGGQIEFSVSDAFGVEFAVSRFSEDGSIADYGSAKLDITTFGLSAIFKRRGETSSLYLLAGVNYNAFDAEVDLVGPYSRIDVRFEAEDDVGFHFGAGVEAPISSAINFFLEYRYTSTNLALRSDWSYMGQSTSIESEDAFKFGLLKMGLNFTF